MARWLRQSTSVDVGIGPFLDATDGVTAETALTLTQPDIRLKKNGGAWAQKAAAQTLSHEENGWYEVTLDATDTNTLGLLTLAVAESGALPVWHEFMVLPANVYDSLVLATDYLQADAQEFGGAAITAGVLPNAAAGSVGGLILRGTSAGQLEPVGGGVTVDGVVDANVAQVNGSTTAAAKLAYWWAMQFYGQVASVVNSGDFTVAGVNLSTVNDHYNGQILVFLGGTNLHQARQISDYTGATGRVQFAGSGSSMQRPFEATPTVGDICFILGIGG